MIFKVCMAFHLDKTVDNVHCRRIQFIKKNKKKVNICDFIDKESVT